MGGVICLLPTRVAAAAVGCHTTLQLTNANGCLSFDAGPLSFPSLHFFYCKATLSNQHDGDIHHPAAVGVKSSFFSVVSVPLQDRHSSSCLHSTHKCLQF